MRMCCFINCERRKFDFSLYMDCLLKQEFEFGVFLLQECGVAERNQSIASSAHCVPVPSLSLLQII